MRVLLWHGWLLAGSGSNVYAARVTEALKRAGHSVLLVCQERHPERYPFIDAWATVTTRGVSALEGESSPDPDVPRVVLLRPEIGSLLPVFVVDEYEGFDRVISFVDLTDAELEAYLAPNAEMLRSVIRWRNPDVVIAGHVVPGAVVAQRALRGGFVAKVHGSDLEYAIRPQHRYQVLAREGLAAARSVVGATRDVLERTIAVAPAIAGRTRVIPPGVEVERFRPRARSHALAQAASMLDADPDTARGRPADLDAQVRRAIDDPGALDALAGAYDQDVPDPAAGERLRALASFDGPLVGYLGKFIPQKGVELLLEALARMDGAVRALIVGFGSHREQLAARTFELGLADRVTFTGRLDHRYAPLALAAMDVLVVPSILEEAFGMVSAEGAAAGALPLVAGHSGLAEVAEALEAVVGHPGLFSFHPGDEAATAIAHGVERILGFGAPSRAAMAATLSAFIAAEWTWDRTADRLLQIALSPPPPG